MLTISFSTLNLVIRSINIVNSQTSEEKNVESAIEVNIFIHILIKGLKLTTAELSRIYLISQKLYLIYYFRVIDFFNAHRA